MYLYTVSLESTCVEYMNDRVSLIGNIRHALACRATMAKHKLMSKYALDRMIACRIPFAGANDTWSVVDQNLHAYKYPFIPTWHNSVMNVRHESTSFQQKSDRWEVTKAKKSK